MGADAEPGRGKTPGEDIMGPRFKETGLRVFPEFSSEGYEFFVHG